MAVGLFRSARVATDYRFFDAPFLAFAHRGGALYPPNLGRENTIAAFRTAVQLGYRYLETDVHATRDDRLVAFHDEHLDRVADSTGAIAELTFDQVRQTLIGGRYQVPTLAELFEAFPDARFNIDCKADEAVVPLARTIQEHDAAGRVCLSSFSPARLHRLRRLLPKAPSAVSSRAIAQLRFAACVSAVPVLRRLINSDGVALQLPVRRKVAGREVTVLTRSLIAAAHRGGKQVHVWTVDEADEMHRLIDLGVDGIFTDRIDTLKSVLIERDLWSSE